MEKFQDIDSCIEYFESWLTKELGLPAWKEVLVTEFVEFSADPLKIEVGKCDSPDNYKERFQLLLSRGYAWINVSALGLMGETLVLHVEHPNQSQFISAESSVNLSGPCEAVQKNGYNLNVNIKGAGQC